MANPGSCTDSLHNDSQTFSWNDVPPVTCNREVLDQCVQYLAQSCLFGWDVCIAGCELRAHIGAFVMQTKQFSTKFDTDFKGRVFQVVLVASNLLLSIPWFSNKKIAIDGHVATAVKLGEETMVLDPLLDKEHALSSFDWAARLDSKITNLDRCFLNGRVTKSPEERENASIQCFAHNSMVKLHAKRKGARINSVDLLMDSVEIYEKKINSMDLEVRQINEATDRVKVTAALLFYSDAIKNAVKSQNDDISKFIHFMELVGNPLLPPLLEVSGYYQRARELLLDFSHSRKNVEK